MEGDDEGGRQARTRGVSLSPGERRLVDRFRQLSGMGLSDQVRHALLSRLPAAIQLLEDMRAAGMTPGETPLAEQVIYAESEGERRGLREDTYEPVDLSSERAVGASS
jgi:hypothetical protein